MTEGGSHFFAALVDRVAHHAYKLENDLLKQRIKAWEQAVTERDNCSFCNEAFPRPIDYKWECPGGDCHWWCGICIQTTMKLCKVCNYGYCNETCKKCDSCGETFCKYCINEKDHNHS